MQSFRVNDHDMAYVEIGKGPPLVLVHGTLGDFRTWNSVMGPLSAERRVISVSLRHFFPEHWDGVGNDYKMAQHISDVIAFIEQVQPRPIDLMGHSRGGHIAFRVAEQRPDLLRKLVLAEPGGVGTCFSTVSNSGTMSDAEPPCEGASFRSRQAQPFRPEA